MCESFEDIAASMGCVFETSSGENENFDTLIQDLEDIIKKDKDVRYAKYGNTIVKIKKGSEVEVEKCVEKEEGDTIKLNVETLKNYCDEDFSVSLKNKKYRLTRSQARAYSNLSDEEKEKRRKLKNLKKKK